MSLVDQPSPATRDAAQLNHFDEGGLDRAYSLRDEAEAAVRLPRRQTFLALTVGAVGVVYGDIRTSPIYAFREALLPVLRDGQVSRPGVLELLSLLIWTLILIVTVRYVIFPLRIDNRGEGGVLALCTMVRLAVGRRSVPFLCQAIIRAALFWRCCDRADNPGPVGGRGGEADVAQPLRMGGDGHGGHSAGPVHRAAHGHEDHRQGLRADLGHFGRKPIMQHR